MLQPQVIQGSGEELARFLQRMKDKQNLLLIIPGEPPSNEIRENTNQTSDLIQFGMFPQLQGLTDEDFQSAEWHGEEVALK